MKTLSVIQLLPVVVRRTNRPNQDRLAGEAPAHWSLPEVAVQAGLRPTSVLDGKVLQENGSWMWLLTAA